MKESVLRSGACSSVRSTVMVLPVACLALGRLTIVGDVDLEAAQRLVPAEAFELDLAVALRRTRGDSGMAELVQVPVRRVLLPERVSLAVGQPRIAARGQIDTARRARFTRRDEQRP